MHFQETIICLVIGALGASFGQGLVAEIQRIEQHTKVPESGTAKTSDHLPPQAVLYEPNLILLGLNETDYHSSTPLHVTPTCSQKPHRSHPWSS